jgi:tRNA pseudouridine55 synthase
LKIYDITYRSIKLLGVNILDGIIIINKPIGITSFDVIRKLRKILKERKIGHTGTLDPLAEGVMIVCIGKSTKLAQDIEAYTKEYIAGFSLGYETDSQDTEGKIIKESDNFNVNLETLKETIASFIGKIKQTPPMFSAIKQDGKKLYHLARNGITIDREARDIEIKYIDILSFNGLTGFIKTKVSKGTYIRTLINDIGKKLGTFATMTSLKRTQVGDISIENSFSIDKIEQMNAENDQSFLLPVETFFDYAVFHIILEKDFILFINGNTVIINNDDGMYKIYYKNNFLGFGKVVDNHLKGYKYF